jgi:nondiscriminating aspartyl-tRNA synthetase
MRQERTLAKQLPCLVGEEVCLKGRVVSIREVGTVRFVDLVDRSGRTQLLLGDACPTPALQSLLNCYGVVKTSSKSLSGYEIHCHKVLVIAAPGIGESYNPEEINSPLKEGGPSLENQLDRKHLSLRSSAQQSITRISSEVIHAAGSFLRSRDFVEIKTPKLVSAGAEGGSGMFEVKYFDKLMYLSQSPQLFKQTMAASPLERVFEIAPVFRFEKHATSRHLNEFTGVDVEFAYPDGLEAVIQMEIDLLYAIREHLLQNCSSELEYLGAKLPNLDNIPMLSLDEAKELLTGEKPSRRKPAKELTPAEEKHLCQWARETYGSDAIVVHSYPAATRPFYLMPYEDNPRRSMSFDLLLRGVEMSSGGIRVHDPDVLEFNLKRKGLETSDFGFYPEVFQYGCPPHGGFGIGLERLVQKFLGFENIREACLFVRDRQRLAP